MTSVFFNLFTNACLSLLTGMIVVSLAIWLFRVNNGPWKVFFLSIPFFKIVVDFCRGLPSNSILYTAIDPYSLPEGHQSFVMMADIKTWLVPTITAIFTVQDFIGRIFQSSVGDYLMIWLFKSFGPQGPIWTLTLVLMVSLFLLARRILRILIFEIERRKDHQKEHLETLAMGFRNVEVYISNFFSGSPFTGGFFKPYICIPRDAYKKLTDEELKAVLAHELGHIRHIDLIVTATIQFLGDLFWFVPGYRWLGRKVDRLREILADDFAVNAGVRPLLLASALLKLKEIPQLASQPVFYSAFFRERSLLKTRIQRLLGESKDPRPRWGWQNTVFRWVVGIWICAAALGSTLGGNYPG